MNEIGMKTILKEMDRITLALTEMTTTACESDSDNGAIGALVGMDDMIADLEAMRRTVVALHRRSH